MTTALDEMRDVVAVTTHDPIDNATTSINAENQKTQEVAQEVFTENVENHEQAIEIKELDRPVTPMTIDPAPVEKEEPALLEEIPAVEIETPEEEAIAFVIELPVEVQIEAETVQEAVDPLLQEINYKTKSYNIYNIYIEKIIIE